MRKRSILPVDVDSQGRVILPGDIARRYGLTAGAKVRVEQDATGFRFSRSSDNLARIYVEPTNQCNLNCLTCMRNVWDEAPGQMEGRVFQRILEGLAGFEQTPEVFLGGYGEPLAHPDILQMVAQAHRAGARVELITNGILLSNKTASQLLEAGLQRLWISLDGASPESYADVRLGAALPQVVDNMHYLKQLRAKLGAATPRLGIAFVAMKRNIRDLPALVHLAKSLGADQFSITNVLPHTPELRDEVLFRRSLNETGHQDSARAPLIALPRIDLDSVTAGSLIDMLKNRHRLSIARQQVNQGVATCPFIEKGSLSVRWDGAVSPCLALLHTHESYLDDHVRRSIAFSVGSLRDRSLIEVWHDPAYTALRERLVQFDFSPCIACNSCEMADSNQEDCFGSGLPACGGCLWAQGFIQCP